ncbi:hypothetical protein FZP57_07735 [Methanothermobacter sp. THM-1]|uniref:hypothetical protein n=1 Tax=Methanothermobacter sp. THM-1 TaxID=2606911 RepID=UPI001366B45C|nr:hypothetical protein [Methanothermobacter sp. THM-1]QHN06930.1 hypothetical protein FZP57_07735 [Methanothermobacter sp. THM-1]
MKILVNNREVPVTGLSVNHMINSVAKATFSTHEEVRVGYSVSVISDDDKKIFEGYVNYVSLDYGSMISQCRAISSPIHNRLMQYTYTFKEAEFHSWGLILLRFLQACGVSLHPRSCIPSQSTSRAGSSYLYGTMIQPGKSTLETFMKVYPFYGMVETEGDVKKVSVTWTELIQNLMEETGRDLFWVLHGKMMYIGCKGNAGFEVNPNLLKSLKITEDATEVVESLENLRVVY